MCGIGGLYLEDSTDKNIDALLHSMCASMHHRGPDSQGQEFFDQTCGLAHTRLAIRALGDVGAQPMHSACGLWVVSFNGELYEHKKLRQALRAAGHNPPWRGHSDTETLVEMLAFWGAQKTLEKLDGMFAWAAWNRSDKSLFLARDFSGEKPLYLGKLSDHEFYFASEIQALRPISRLFQDTDKLGWDAYFRHGFFPAPHTPYSAIRKILPGMLLRIDAQGEHVVCVQSAFSPPTERTNPEDFSDKFLQAVEGCLDSDVPVGAFLSGGYDSSAVAAAIRRGLDRPLDTFTIAFAQWPKLDESKHAEAVAKHLGCQHTCLEIAREQALDIVPNLAQIYGEPFADSSQIPTLLVAQLARKKVTVALSGDGADELLHGYARTAWAYDLHKRYAWLPGFVQKLVAQLLHLGTPQRRQPVEILRCFAHDRALMSVLMSQDPKFTADPLALSQHSQKQTNTLHHLARWDRERFLADDILVKVDRASMAHSLEVRAPFLRREFIRYAQALPEHATFAQGRGKAVLKDWVHQFVPAPIMQRPKQGFAIPLAQWLTSYLREWADDLLNPAAISQIGLDPQYVLALWHQLTPNDTDNATRLWTYLMGLAHQRWMRQSVSESPSGSWTL